MESLLAPEWVVQGGAASWDSRNVGRKICLWRPETQTPSIQHHPPLQAAGEVADAVGTQDVISEHLAGPAQLDGDVRLLSQVRPCQPNNLREPPDRRGAAGGADGGVPEAQFRV